MPGWVQTGVTDYLSRIPPRARPQLIEIPRPKGAHKDKDRKAQLLREAEAILSKTSSEDWVIALDREGKPITTEQWSSALEKWQLESRKVVIVIGGSDGLASGVIKRAQERWSLSNLTFPHMMVRVMVAEQHYRAWSLSQGLPYHK